MDSETDIKDEEYSEECEGSEEEEEEYDEDDEDDVEYDRKLDDLLKYVDLAIDINSICGFPAGWAIKGRLADLMKTGAEGNIKGRVLAIIGEYKVGKTWLQRMLLGTEQIDSSEIHTPGVCMKFVEKKVVPRKKPASTAPKPVKRSNLLKKPGTTPQRKLPMKHAKPAPLGSNIDYIVLDSAGTNAACGEGSLSDLRATELLLRKILIKAANKLIYVTSRLNRQTQVAIRAVIDQLRESGKRITPENRLLVVHNMADVTDEVVLQRRIKEVERVYKDEANAADEVSWEAVTKDVVITTPSGTHNISCTYYEARLTTHIFLVNHGVSAVENEQPEWRIHFNLAAIEVVKSLMFFGVDAKLLNLLDVVIDVASTQLPKYVKDFDGYEITVKNYDGVTHIVPWKADNETTETTNNEGIEPFTLNAITFTDNDVISENEQRIEGEEWIGEKEYVLTLKVPGVRDKEQVLAGLTTMKFQHVRLEITRPHPLEVAGFNPEDFIAENGDKRWGRSVYTWRAPEGQFFENLSSRAKKDAATTLCDGVLAIRLKRETDEEEEDEEEGENYEPGADQEGDVDNLSACLGNVHLLTVTTHIQDPMLTPSSRSSMIHYRAASFLSPIWHFLRRHVLWAGLFLAAGVAIVLRR